jgi:hypothetical protein
MLETESLTYLKKKKSFIRFIYLIGFGPFLLEAYIYLNWHNDIWGFAASEKKLVYEIKIQYL